MFDFWWRPALMLGGILFAALLAAALFGVSTGIALFVLGLIGYLVHHLRQMAALIRWLERGERGGIPQAYGAWDDIFYGLERLLRKQKRSTTKLSALLDRFEHAAQAIPDGIVMLNGTDQIDWFNPAASRHFSLDDATDRGQFIGYLIRQAPFHEYLAGHDYSEPLIMKSPASRDVSLSVQLVPFGDKRKMLISRDITQIELIDSMRRDFVANVSHELRTPLTVVGGFLETFADMEHINQADFHRYSDLMQQQTERMRMLVEDLLTLSRLESPQNRLQESAVNVPELAQSLFQDARSLSGEHHQIQLFIECDRWIKGNPDELRSAFGNLVSNAVRYTPHGGSISLRWAVRGGEACFSVSDTGDGIEPQHIPRLTERFYRVDRGRSRETGGTGLGLAIVKHVLTRHQARLLVDSQVGKGSCFAACFPSSRVEEPQTG
ncbi:MAG: phosphate regulon sensor histidine kinase PhoR [Sulfuriferula sp.]